jgi:hypothetical protein
MLVSAEVRWFKRGDPGEALRRCFDTPGCGGGRERVDIYSVDRSSDELGIKQREGRPGVEVKALVHPAVGCWRLGPCSGALQLWTRSTSRVLTLPAETTRTTRKTRVVRIFEPSAPGMRELELGGGPFREDPVNEGRPALGCHVELARVDIDGEQWSTFAVQSFAEDAGRIAMADVSGCLRPMFEYLSERDVGSQLGGWQEKSYPRWLKDLVGG